MAELQEAISQVKREIQKHYREHPPADVKLERLKLQAFALLYIESPRAAHNFWVHYSKPVEDVEIEKIRLQALCLRELDKDRVKKTFLPKPELGVTNLTGEVIPEPVTRRMYTTVHSDVIETDLFGKKLPPKERKKLISVKETKEYARMQSGIITMFEKAECYGHPVDAINYWLNKRGRRTAFGDFIGFVYGAFPVPCVVAQAVRVMFSFTVKEPHIEARKAHKRNLKRLKIKPYQYRDLLEGNTLTDFVTREAEVTKWKKENPDVWYEIKLAGIKNRSARKEARKKRDEGI